MYDTVVLGLGGVGSFALRAVARDCYDDVQEKRSDDGDNQTTNKRKRKLCLGIERFKCCHFKGSSHGKSRVYRRAYFEHSNYVPWINFSVEEFHKLQEESNTPIIEECGVLMAVPSQNDDDNPNNIDHHPVLKSAINAAKEHDITIEQFSTQQLRQKFPQFRFLENALGIYEPGGGFVRPENAIQAALLDAKEYGAEIREETVVKSIREININENNNDGGEGIESYVEICIVSRSTLGNTKQQQQQEEEVIKAKHVLVAAGAWTSELIPSYKQHLRVTRQLQGWVSATRTNADAISNPSMYSYTRMPCAAFQIPNLKTPFVYVVPADSINSDDGDEYRNCIKMGIHGRTV